MQIYIALKKERKKKKKERKRHERPAKTQIGLGIRPVWSEFSLFAWRKLGSLPSHWAHIEDYDLTGRMPRLIWVFAGRKDHFVGSVMRRLIYFRRAFAFKLKCSCWKEKCRCVDIFCEISPKYLNVIIQIYQFKTAIIVSQIYIFCSQKQGTDRLFPLVNAMKESDYIVCRKFIYSWTWICKF